MGKGGKHNSDAGKGIEVKRAVSKFIGKKNRSLHSRGRAGKFHSRVEGCLNLVYHTAEEKKG